MQSLVFTCCLLSLTDLTATLSVAINGYNVLPLTHVATVLTVANPMLSANVLQLTVSFNVLTWF